jgi:hypothetical protein
VSQVSCAAMLSDVSTYRRVRSRAVIQKLTPGETYVRMRRMGYDLFVIRESIEKCEISDEQKNEVL